jgi:hypothetical protein
VILGYNCWSRQTFGVQIGPNLWLPAEVFNKYELLEKAGSLSSIPLPPLFDHVDRNLANLRHMGIKVVRWFLLGNGNNYGPRPQYMVASGSPSNTPGYHTALRPYYRFKPPLALDKRFKRDFAELLMRFKNADMQIIPSLISFEFAGDEAAGPGANGTWYGGRADVIRDPVARKDFLDTMLAALLDASTGFEKQIYAWEVMNEPIWPCLEYGPLSSPRWRKRGAETTIAEVSDFLKDAISRIEKAGFRSTVGHRYFDDLKVFPTGNVPQFHYYADDAWYNSLGGGKNDPPLKGLFNATPKPVLGEFDSPPYESKDKRKPWKFAPPTTDSILERLRLLESVGCDLAMIWPDMSDHLKKVIENDVLKLQDATRQGIVAYTGGKLPPANE